MRRLIWSGVLAATASGLVVAGSSQPEQVERLYSRGVYPVLAGNLATASAFVPFSLAEALPGLGGLWLLARGAPALRRRRSISRDPDDASASRATRASRLSRWGSRVALLACGGYLLFLLLWGLNYRRPPVGELLRLSLTPAGLEELAELAAELLSQAGALRASLSEDGGGAARPLGGVDGVLRRASLAYESTAREPLLAGLVAPALARAPKPMASSRLLSYLGITGIYVPFTAEALVNVEAPGAGLPFAACHELAHQQGFAREDEANFVGYLACRAHPDGDFRYSAAFEAAGDGLGALRRIDPQRAAKLSEAAAPGVIRDWRALSAWLRRHEGPALRASYAVNDAYLRSQGQREGIRSYGRVVDLLLAERRARVRRATTGRPTTPAAP